MGHVEDRAKERTKITNQEIASARSYVKNHRKSFRKGQTYSIVAPGRKGYYIVGDVGDKRKKHVIKTVYGVNMRPPGNLIQNAKLEHDLVKAAEALFTLEKTASAVSYSIALMEYDKVASAYFGYELNEWLDYTEEMRKEAVSMVPLQRFGAGVLQKGSKLLGGNQTLARGSAKLRGGAAKTLERQSTLTSNVDKATKLQAQAAEQSAKASQQARFAGNTDLASRQAAHAQRQVGNAQANVANRNVAARVEGEAAYKAGNPVYSIPTAPVSYVAPKGVSPVMQRSAVQQYNQGVTRSGTRAVEDLAYDSRAFREATQATNRAAAQIRSRAGNPNIVNTKAPKAAPKAPAETGAGANAGGGSTARASKGTGTPPPPATPDPSGISLKQVGLGAGLATAGIGTGYGAKQYIKSRNRKNQQQAAMPMQPMAMPKMATWYSFVDKTASYSDALGMYKEALSRADKNLLKEYKKAEEAARVAVKQEGEAVKKMQQAYKDMPKGPKKTAARNAFKEAQKAYNYNANNPPTVESFLKEKGYKGDQLKATQGKLKGKLFGQRNQAAMRNAVFDQRQVGRDLKYKSVETLENMSKKLDRNNELFDDARRAADKKPQKLRLGERQGGMSNAFNAEARAEKFLKRKGVDITTPAGQKEVKRLSEKLYDASTTTPNSRGRLIMDARVYGPNTPYHFDPVTGAARSRAAKREIAALSPSERSLLNETGSFSGTSRSTIADRLDRVDRGVDRRGVDALKADSATLQQKIDKKALERSAQAKAVNTPPPATPKPVVEAPVAKNPAPVAKNPAPAPVQNADITSAVNKAKARPTPIPQPAPTPQSVPGKAPLPSAANVNPQQAANQTIKSQATVTKAPPPVPKTTPTAPLNSGTTKTVTTMADDAAKTVVPKVAPKGRLGMLLGGAALTGAGLYGLNRMSQQEKAASVEYRGRTFPGYNKPMKSDRPNKKKMVLAKKGDEVKLIHYGHSGYKHNYSKSAKKNYLTRSAGIRNKSGGLTMNDKFSANYWARRDLWPKGQKADGSDKKR